MKVLVLGGAGAIGSAIVQRFAGDGHDVAFTYAHSAEAALALAHAQGTTSHHYDVTVDNALPEIEADIVVYNVGVNLSGHGLLAVAPEELLRSFKINTMGAITAAQRYLPGMVERGFGRLVHVNSLWGLKSPDLRLSYAASKFALRATTTSLALEYADSGVTINEVCPGPVDSAMLRAMGEAAVSAGRAENLGEYLRTVAGEVPIRRLILPQEVASACAWLASRDAAACTGVSLRIDGGALA